MNEFIKKHYWLITILVCTLFLFFLSASVKAIFNPSLDNPLKYHFFRWSRDMASVEIPLKQRIKDIAKLSEKFNMLNKNAKNDYQKMVKTSLANDQIIQSDLITVQNILRETDGLKSSLAQLTNKDMLQLREILRTESEFWRIYGNHAVRYLTNKTTYNSIRLIVDLKRQRNILISSYDNYNSHLKGSVASIILSRMFFFIFSFVLLLSGTIGTGYFIFSYIYPVGFEKWSKKNSFK